MFLSAQAEQEDNTTMIAIKGKDRRRHARHTAHVIMEIRGPVRGSRVTEIRGVTVDMSCGGALAVFTEQVESNPDDTFMVRFVDTSGTVIAPDFRWGTVVRSDRLRSDCVVAVKFDRPLPAAVMGRLLSADRTLAKRAYA